MTPTITYPISYIDQPSTKKKLKFRPYLVKEEKILLMAKETNEYTTIMQAIKDILQNCCQEQNFDINKVTLFDLEWMFLKLRAISVNNVENLVYLDSEDKVQHKHQINFDNIKIIYSSPDVKNKITVGEFTVVLRYPSADLFNEENLEEKITKNGIYELVIHCIDNIFRKEELLKLTFEEKKEFLDNMDIKSFASLKEFIYNIPHLEPIEWEFVNTKGTPRKLVFRTLKDFFFLL